MIIPLRRRGLVLAVAGAALAAGSAFALYYHRLGLTLSHYDARGHLVVSRRIFDSITPGWQQIGAVWLPLPHLLNALPIQIDAFYRTGASAVAISVLSYAVACASIAWIVAAATSSVPAAILATLVFALNPNVLYLQATPMTELLLIALLLLSIALLLEWCTSLVRPSSQSESGSPRLSAQPEPPSPRGPSPRVVGASFALACLTRYEAWPVTAAAFAAAVWCLWRRGDDLASAARRVVTIAIYPALAVGAFFIFSRVVGGSWFASDFFVPENPAQGLPLEVIKEIVWGTRELSGRWILVAGSAGLGLLLVLGVARRDRPDLIIPVALLAAAAVAFAAFLDGHPYRIRYMMPLLASEAIGVGVVAGMWGRGRIVLLPALLVLTLFELRPLDDRAPMIVEAQWDRPNIAGRAPVTRCLADGYHGETVMASMGSLGHYMQALSASGLYLKDFLHEGNGDIWLNALVDPAPYAGWLMIEEKAEGGDMLDHIARKNPSFLDGFSRVCEGAGVALYRRRPPAPALARSER